MKLVLATPLYPPDIGGPATDAANLAAYLTHKGMAPAIACFADLRRLPKGIRHIAYLWRLLGKSRNADGIVAFDTVSVGMPAALASILTGRPLVVRVPGDYAWEQGVQRFGVHDTIDDFQKKRYGWRVELLRTVQLFVVRRARLVVTPSDYFKGVVARWGVPPERLMRIYLGLDGLEAAEVPPAVPGGKILFSLGRLVPWKGFSMLIALVQKLSPEWKLVIAGSGPLRAKLAEEVRSLGVAERVIFTGPLPHATVLGWMRRADAFVLNTAFESFSFQVLEAMLSGSRIIATTAGSLPELIADGREGILCAPNDRAAFTQAIERIEREPEAWEARRAAAQQKAAAFAAQTSLEAFQKAVQSVCG